MSPRIYSYYRFSTAVKRRLYKRMSPAGRVLLIISLLAILFGFNTRLTMIYQLAALAVALLLVSFPLSFFCVPGIQVRRMLPDTCTAGERLTYRLRLKNGSSKLSQGIFYTELPLTITPSYEEFATAVEDGESDRNAFDRKFAYYRWQWLIERKAGAKFVPSALPLVPPNETMTVEVSFVPLRRGYIRLSGYSLHRLDPFGLFKNEVQISDAQRILVLPRLYPVAHGELAGSRKYYQGGLTSAASYGESGEFVALREYRQGDPVKHIDWKSTARVGSAIVRQYQEEYFSRLGVLLDTFTAQANDVFEDAVSVAASIIAKHDAGRSHIDLLFACDSCVSSVSMGRGEAGAHRILEVLASITPCSTGSFQDLAKIVFGHSDGLSGLILVLLDMDEQRKKLITYLASNNIPHTIILVSSDWDKATLQLQNISSPNTAIFDTRNHVKVVHLP